MVPLIPRQALHARVARALRDHPVAVMLGPRQSGKTTLARQIATARRAHYFDLEDPRSAARLEQPMLALESLRGLIVIDEVQYRPELFGLLRVLADRRPLPARFLLLGSASPDLVRGASESLAGRAAFVTMSGFGLDEVGVASLRRLWWRGGFPPAYTARTDAVARDWQEYFVQTFLERDLRPWGVLVPAATLRRLWMMLAHHHGQIWNASEIGRSLGMAHTSVKHHLDILTGGFVVRQLPPWFENISKRQVRSPKVYVRDSGLLHSLLGLVSIADLEAHPKLGASWEGFVVEEIVRRVGESNAWFWSTQAGAKIDVLVQLGSKRVGIEIKYADAPRPTKSMHIAKADLGLEAVWCVYPGRESGPIGDGIEMVAVGELSTRLDRALGLRRKGAR